MNTIENILDNVTSFIVDPGNESRTPLTQGIAWAITIILGIGTLGIAQCLSTLWRKLRQIDQNETHEEISQIFSKSHPNSTVEDLNPIDSPLSKVLDSQQPLSNVSKTSCDIQPIDSNFTINQLIDEQRKAHSRAKTYMQAEAGKINAEVVFVSPPHSACPPVNEVAIKLDLDQTVFAWENTKGVQGDIQKDGKLLHHVVLYGVASQFNACEAVDPFTPKPGTAVETYKGDPTQGPGAQLQFPDQQVEIINDAANLGFNGLCHVLDETTKGTIRHGYLTPKTPTLAETVIAQLRENGHKMEFPCIGNIPKQKGNTEKVYVMLVAAPAFGKRYSKGSTITDNQKKEMEFLCALSAYRAQFQQVIQLATLNPEKQVIFKPTAPGLGVFGNRIENVAKAFYMAAKEYENQLIENKISVRLQVFGGQGDARNMAAALGLDEFKK